jgi:1,4-alpha-glucan branching enzyme
MEEFRNMINEVHRMGMHLILDWVANHCAWDNEIVRENPDWFTQNDKGEPIPPNEDWTDVVDLNYDEPEVREYMLDAMKYWMMQADIDGYRCDVAEMVPMEFWAEVRSELDKIKPVFMLAEGSLPALHENGFDMTYNWELYELMNDIARGEKNAEDLNTHFVNEAIRYDHDDYRMQFTSNHDKNFYDGTVFERLGPGSATFAVLTATIPGMPLIYNGQEAGLDKRLEFFEHDPIQWKDHPFTDLYRKLFLLKRENPALWNGIEGAPLLKVPTDNDKDIFAFIRMKKKNRILVILNLSGHHHLVTLKGHVHLGTYQEIFNHKKEYFSEGHQVRLKPWQYLIYQANEG